MVSEICKPSVYVSKHLIISYDAILSSWFCRFSFMNHKECMATLSSASIVVVAGDILFPICMV
uniref:Uncharacterized protein n=1 Tax=Arundo donax TaxID=35708 RepID=A0A0A8YM43_ARUDO